MLDHAVQARLDPPGRQVVEVPVHHGYRPHTIEARAGRPLRIVFDRRDDEPCSERVVFSSPRLDRRLAPNGLTVIDLPAQPPGEVRFTCAMGRYRGRIQLVADAGSSSRERLGFGGALDRPGRRALVLWLLTLPLVAIPSITLLDLGMAIIIALVSLLAWLVGCRWAFGQSRTRA